MMVAGAIWIAIVIRRHGGIWRPAANRRRGATRCLSGIGTAIDVILRKIFGAVNTREEWRVMAAIDVQSQRGLRRAP